MIRTNNAELDAVIEMLQTQRNEAQDAVVILAAKLRTQETLTAELQKQLEKPKEGDA